VGQVGTDFPAEKNLFFFPLLNQLVYVRSLGSRTPVFNRSVSDLLRSAPVTHQDQGIRRNLSMENFFPPLASSLAPENCRYHAVSKVNGSQILWLTLSGSNPMWLTAWAYHLIKSSPSCLDFRDGAAANQVLWLLTNPFKSSLPHPSRKNFLRQTPWSYRKPPGL
jgi:hypothetical protein